jgi:nitrile hydratase beta subunit
MTNSVHDMGGMYGFGPVEPEDNEPLFHEPWEARVLGMMMTSMALFEVTLDNVRSRMEHIPPATYLKIGYYDKWLLTLEQLAVEKGLLSRDDLAALAEGKEVPLAKDMDPIPPEGILGFMAVGTTAAREMDTPAAFKVGGAVRAKNLNGHGHTRLPRYVRGHVGTVQADRGGQIYPEVSARLEGDGPERLYTVRFTARELWGDDANPNDTVCIDLWEPYLEAVDRPQG